MEALRACWRTKKPTSDEGASRYARERLLYRLSLFEHRDRLILKGALLFSYWTGAPHRPTRDIDFLGYDPPVMETAAKVFKELYHVELTPDDLTFPDSSAYINSQTKTREGYFVRFTC